mgnify:CR=1 FL=1
MRLHELAKVIIDVIVVGRAWQVEHCLSLINVVVRKINGKSYTTFYSYF